MAIDTIQKWHVGKLIILWGWGGGAAALLLTAFQSGSITAEPFGHLLELAIAIALLAGLSAVTWCWLGDRKPSDAEPKRESVADV